MQTLIVTFNDGSKESVSVACGSAKGARRLPARIGRALKERTASAVLAYDGKPRTAVVVSGRFYMRVL